MLVELPAEERGRHVLGLENAGMARWYIDLADKLRKRVSFQVADLAPDEMIRVPRLFRFDGNLDQAAERLIADRGLAIALRRLGGLPVAPPPSISAAVASLDATQLLALLDEAQLAPGPAQQVVGGSRVGHDLPPKTYTGRGERARTGIWKNIADGPAYSALVDRHAGQTPSLPAAIEHRRFALGLPLFDGRR